MAQYDAADFVKRLRFFTGGRRWSGSQAWGDGSDGKPVGQLYALTYSIAQGLARLMGLWTYTRQQTRLATISDEYVDRAWTDFFRGRARRNVGESDAASTLRLRQRLIATTGTHDAVLAAVQSYYTDFPAPIASYDVFDRQTDPVRSARYGLRDAQFAVITYRPYTARLGWYLAQGGYLGQTTFLSDPYGFNASFIASDPELARRVEDVKDQGYRPVYIESRGEPAGAGSTFTLDSSLLDSGAVLA
jgi:hypothetical protein